MYKLIAFILLLNGIFILNKTVNAPKPTDKLVGIELTKNDLDDPEKYDRNLILSLHNDISVCTSKEMDLIDEIVNIVINCEDCSMEFKSLDKCNNVIIYRDKKFNNKYDVDWFEPDLTRKQYGDWFKLDHRDIIRIIRNGKHEFRLQSISEMLSFFSPIGQVDHANFKQQSSLSTWPVDDCFAFDDC